jgi:hypothetical protein
MIELTAEEMRRLPNLSTPGLELPPLPEDDFYSFNDPNLGNEFDDLKLDPLEPNSEFSESYVPPIPYIPPPPVFDFSIPPRPTPQTNLPQPQPQPSPSIQPSPSPSVSPSQPRPTESPLYSQQPTDSVPELDQLGPSVNTPSDQEMLQQARSQQMQRLLAQQQELSEQFAYNPEGTSTDAARTAFVQWLDDMGRQELADPDDLLRQEITLPYPRAACLIRRDVSRQPVHAVFGVVLGQDGAIVEDRTQLLQSSGFEFFNQKAEEAIATHEFANDSEPNQLYLVTVKFEYDQENCPAAGNLDDSVGNAPDSEPASNAQTSPVPLPRASSDSSDNS